ncbi:MAG TPA: twin-arginine translocase TatA/TatE family subunit [Verrucomicrobiae bacterium]|nr:twin-arginine translocase TatA/TatE family subunit [Verrucomicrobiae bacterium]
MDIGFREILLILLIILILFGAKRIPEMMRAMGQGVKEFKKAAKDIQSDDEADSSAKPAAPSKNEPGKPA